METNDDNDVYEDPDKVFMLVALPLLTATPFIQPAARVQPAGATSVHDFNGQRDGVPQHDLATDRSGLLRNGLKPQPLEGG